ncbi:hypothetical protein CR513_50230, partial [Mucuna pruriens]
MRAFELLCEDMGRAPSLSVFFWFFSLHKTTKVGWTSLSSRPKHKLLKPFLESFKVFKNCYFKVGRGATGPNLLADNSGEPFFHLYWTPQLAVYVLVARKDLEKWEDEFIEELNEVPLISSADLIKGAEDNLPAGDATTSAQTIPLAAAELGDAPHALVEETPQVQPMVILDSLEDSPFSAEADQTLGGKRTAGDDGENLERPGKHANLEVDDFVLGAPNDHPTTKTGGNAIIEEVLIGLPSSPQYGLDLWRSVRDLLGDR